MRKFTASILSGLALFGLIGVTLSHAQVQVTIGLPLPVFAVPAPAYYPAPVYYPPPVVYAPAPRVVYRQPVYYAPPVVYARPVYRHHYGHYGHNGHSGHNGHWR